ncbi:MAG: LicD family protein [Lachnospiraceae bacterium]|nr:LicD family protein [Lachnospiraceae bacterium]
MMKRYWAAELTVLSEIDRICRKYDIPWFADCGTLLGAVRHGGFIPWDDDLDICMLRSDQLRFLKVAKEELPQGFCILNIHTEKDYNSMLCRVVNAHEINTNEEHLRYYHGCPYTVGIDIFPLDDLSPDQNAEDIRIEQVKRISRCLDLIASEGIDAPEVRRLLSELEQTHHTVLHRHGAIGQELRLLVEKLYTSFSSETAEHVALMHFWVLNHDHKYKKSWFQHRVFLPFENTFIPVPAVYNEVLRVEYGDFMQVHKGGGIHDYPVYHVQEAILKDTVGQNPYRYTMTDALPAERAQSSTWEERFSPIPDILLEAHSQINQHMLAGESDDALSLLTECQSLAITLGNGLEKEYPQEGGLVHILEEYCETVFLSGESWTEASRGKLDSAVFSVRDSLMRLIQEKKKTVLFLPIKASWWSSMEPLWEKVREEPDTEVIVMSVPYSEGDLFGTEQGRRVDDFSLFPDHVNPIHAEEYDIAARHPDTIYIQYPFDEWSTTMQLPAFFYSSNLRACTNELIYVPCFVPDDPIDENDKAVSAIRVLVEQPAVLNADRVLLPTEKMKRLYVDTLVALSKREASFWEARLVVEGCLAGRRRTDRVEEWFPGKKVLLFYVDASFLLEYREMGLQKLEYARKIIEENNGKLVCLFSYGMRQEEMDEIAPALWEGFRQFLRRLERSRGFRVVETGEVLDRLETVSAYYGVPGVLAHRVRERGGAVMIMNGEV